MINRQDVIARLKKAEDVFRQNEAKLEATGIHYAMELVESDIEIPTVEPEITNDDLQAAMTESYHLGYELAEAKFKRPQGKWINEWREIEGGRAYGACCSLCHINGHSGYNFCPKCGADMREEADNE